MSILIHIKLKQTHNREVPTPSSVHLVNFSYQKIQDIFHMIPKFK
uniref:Uncharacterized protein n=1 Tax=Rhizophora mucronata TaxID=61149 RepID=A0A2P2J3G6_RHIMU